MQRRQYITTIAATGATVLAGCSAIPGMGDSGPEYEDMIVEDLMLPESTFPSDWTRDDTINENFDGVFVNGDETMIVLIKMKIHESVGDAEDDYQESINGVRDPQEMDFADEAFWDTRDGLAITLFRDSNVEAQAASASVSGGELEPEQRRSQKYARELHDYMQSV